MRQWKRPFLASLPCLWGLSSLEHVAQNFFGLTACEAMQSVHSAFAALTAGSIGGLRSLVMFPGLRIRGQGGVRNSCL